MNCPYCGKETDEQRPFCIHCGSPMPQAGQAGQAPPQAGVPAPPPGIGQPPAGQPPEDATRAMPAQPPAAPAPYAPPGPQPQAPPPQQYAPQGPYPQQTMQIPAAPVSGAYQQPAYGQGPYAPAPPGGYPQGQYAQNPQYAQQYPAARRGSTVLGLLALIAGGAVVGSTFLPWLTVMGLNVSGLRIMTGGSGLGGSGMSIVLTGGGTVFFTAFFSLLLGSLIMIGGILMLFRRRIGGALAFVFAIAAAGMASVNIAMVYAKMTGSHPGVGLWMFGGAAIAALIFGFVGLVSSGG